VFLFPTLVDCNDACEEVSDVYSKSTQNSTSLKRGKVKHMLISHSVIGGLIHWDILQEYGAFLKISLEST
jgi:hypothetical protein